MTSGEGHDTHSSQSLEKIITLALDRCTFAYLNRTNSEQVQGKRPKTLTWYYMYASLRDACCKDDLELITG